MHKPTVPQFVADWYEDNQDNFEFNLYRLFVDYENCELNTEMMIWFHDKNNNPIQTITAIHQVGYEVKKKEKLYTVEVPNPNYTVQGHYMLYKNEDGKVCLDYYYSDDWRNCSFIHLTEGEIKEDFAWLWRFAEEVEK